MGETHGAGQMKRYSKNKEGSALWTGMGIGYEVGWLPWNLPLHFKSEMTQTSAYKDCKTSLKDNEALIVVNFKENFACKYIAEAQ